MNILDALAKNRLSKDNYPALTSLKSTTGGGSGSGSGGGGGGSDGGGGGGGGSSAEDEPPPVTKILVFVVGGATYEEAAKVAEWNRNNAVRVLLGAPSILSSASFLAEIEGVRVGGGGGGGGADGRMSEEGPRLSYQRGDSV